MKEALPPNLTDQCKVWLAIGVQSFGGGTATLALIQREIVHRRAWVGESDFARDWALCQLAPGINLLALAVLIGRRLGGRSGALVAMAGLILPSIAIAIVLTAAYASERRSPIVQDALKAVVPAVAAVGIATSAQMGRPLIREARQRSPLRMVVTVTIGFGAAIVYSIWSPPVPLLLVSCAALAMAASLLAARRSV